MAGGRVPFLLVTAGLLTLFLTTQSDGDDNVDDPDAGAAESTEVPAVASTTIVVSETTEPKVEVEPPVPAEESTVAPTSLAPQTTTTATTVTETVPETTVEATTTEAPPTVTTTEVITVPPTTATPTTVASPTSLPTTTRPAPTSTAPPTTARPVVTTTTAPPPTTATTTTVLVATGPPPTPPTDPPTTTIAPTTTAAPTTTVAPTTTAAPTTTVAPTTTAAPTTTVVPTTTAAAVCTATITDVKPHDVKNNSDSGPSAVDRTVVVEVQVSGSCPSLGLAFDPVNADGSGLYQPRWLLFGGATSITIASPTGEGWSDGDHTIRLQNGQASPVLDTAVLGIK